VLRGPREFSVPVRPNGSPRAPACGIPLQAPPYAAACLRDPRARRSPWKCSSTATTPPAFVPRYGTQGLRRCTDPVPLYFSSPRSGRAGDRRRPSGRTSVTPPPRRTSSRASPSPCSDTSGDLRLPILLAIAFHVLLQFLDRWRLCFSNTVTVTVTVKPLR
jgi:hypothetical protein